MVSTTRRLCQRIRPNHHPADTDSPLPLYKKQQHGHTATSPSSSNTSPEDNQHHHHARAVALNQTRKALGLNADPPQSAVRRMNNTHMKWTRIRLILREPILEFWGVFIYVLFGDSVLAQVKLSGGEYGNWVSVCFGWAVGLMFGIYVAGDSGAYLNPAITLTNCIFRGIPLKRFPIYTAAQVLGAFCAHAVVYANVFSAIDVFEGGVGIRTVPPSETSSAAIFCAFPAGEFVPKGSQVLCEFIANFAVTFCIFAVRDENGADMKGGGGNFVFAYGWLNFVLFSSFGWLTSSPINPGRDIAGRAWLTIMGYEGAWTTMDAWAWVPIVIPFLACLTGGLVYDIFIYTGESPINTDGWGIDGLWYLLSCGRSRRMRRDEFHDEQERKNAVEEDDASALEHGFGSIRSLEQDRNEEMYAQTKQHEHHQPHGGSGNTPRDTNTGYEDGHGEETADLDHKADKDNHYDNAGNDQGEEENDHQDTPGPATGASRVNTPRSRAPADHTPVTSVPVSRSGNCDSTADYFSRDPSRAQGHQPPRQQLPPNRAGPARQGTGTTIASRTGRYDDMSTPTTLNTLRNDGRSGAAAGVVSSVAVTPAGRAANMNSETTNEQHGGRASRWQWANRWNDAALERKIGKDSYITKRTATTNNGFQK